LRHFYVSNDYAPKWRVFQMKTGGFDEMRACCEFALLAVITDLAMPLAQATIR